MPPYGNSVGQDKGYDVEAAVLKNRAVKPGATPEGITVFAAATDRAVGIVLFGVTSAEILRGKGATVREGGIAEWEAGAAIVRGASVTTDSVGRCVTAASGGTNRVYGYARQAASAAGDVIAVSVDFDNPPILA